VIVGRIAVCAGSLGAALASVAVVAAAAPHAAPRAHDSTRKLHGNNFFSNCGFSHTSNDDPIVYPGQPGKSHAHTFFGNTSTRAASTPATLRAAGTTCKVRADKAAYWIPTLYENGREVRPTKGQFYYVLRGYDELEPFPAGLGMIAGDAHARRAQPTDVTYWTCGGRGGARLAPSSTVPRCGMITTTVHALLRGCRRCRLVPTDIRRRVETFLELHVNFPDCWDGKRLDSPDHMSHMAYSRDYVCPRSHPVKVPLIRLMVRYPTRGGAGVELASGGQLSGHADFFNGWDERVLARLVETCFNDRPCDPRRVR